MSLGLNELRQDYKRLLYIYIHIYKLSHQDQLEQLECLHSEDTPAASWLPILLSHIGSQVKRRQSQSYKFKEFAKVSNFWILKQTLYATKLLKLLDKMCKYEMDPMSIVEDTERTRFCPQMDRRTRCNQYTPIINSKAWLRWIRNHLGQPNFPSGNLKFTIVFTLIWLDMQPLKLQRAIRIWWQGCPLGCKILHYVVGIDTGELPVAPHAARRVATPRVRGGASIHGSWRKIVVNFYSTMIIKVVAIKPCNFWSRIICS